MSRKLISDPVIVLERVSRVFDRRCVVDGISLAVGRGSGFGLLGANGAGKSTTLKMIYGSLRPSAGRILVNGMDVVRQPRQVKRQLGIVPQDDLLDGDLGVYDNLLFHARYAGISGRNAHHRAQQLLESMELDPYADQLIGQLSSGLRRRLVLARALLGAPSILVLDEPTRGLDRDSRQLYLEKLRQLKKEGLTLLVATHLAEELEAVCDRAAIMDQGRLVESGSFAEICKLAVRHNIPMGEGRAAPC
ncbi:ABC transporter ATP-binding protein [Trichloromonas sp.]|uniref:ABC transporter ATP-binding protein n=1 Tax=Trichloromonas sp. TaxID=3069249 RepID=UPI003D812D60